MPPLDGTKKETFKIRQDEIVEREWIPGEERVDADPVLVPEDARGRLRRVLGAAREVDVAAELHEDVAVADDARVRHCNRRPSSNRAPFVWCGASKERTNLARSFARCCKCYKFCINVSFCCAFRLQSWARRQRNALCSDFISPSGLFDPNYSALSPRRPFCRRSAISNTG